MDDATESNPLAEVALALAMGFFSIMVLAMISMAAEHTSAVGSSAAVREAVKVDFASPSGATETITVTDQRVVIFHRGVYLNPDLTPYTATAASREPLILAIAPNTSLAASIAARSGLEGGDITMTVLDEAWMARLKGDKG